MTISRPTRWIVALLLVVAAAGACSSNGSTGDPTTTASSAPSGAGTTEPEDGRGTEAPGTTRSTTAGSVPAGDATEEDYVAALLANMAEDEDPVFTASVLECLAPRWVAAVGVAGFEEAGITPADLESGDQDLSDLDLDRDTAIEIADAIPACGVDLAEALIDELASTEEPEVQECLRERFTPEVVRDLTIGELLGEETGVDPDALVEECIPPLEDVEPPVTTVAP